MDRLTKNDLNEVCYDPWELCGMDNHCTKDCHEEGGCTKGCHILKMYRKLAEYEDLEEQGLLLKLPSEENVNGVLNKHIYSNHAFLPNEVELFEKIEKALGFKLFRWQKTFLTMGSFRQYGETTARILRDLLAVNYRPLDLSTARTPVEKLHRDYYRNIQERLTAAGIPTRTVFYNKRDINRYYGNNRHYGKNTSVVLIDEMATERALKEVEGE